MNMLLREASQGNPKKTPVFFNREAVPVFSIYIDHQPQDNVWTAMSADIPGLNIEGETKEEAKEEAERLGAELLVDNKVVRPWTTVRFVFIER
jgi:hypothetical protein